MKRSVLFSIVLALAAMTFSAPAQAETRAMRFSNASPETIETILNITRANGCDDQSEDWDCETEVENRSGTIDSWACRNSDEKWACYEDIKESCRERNSGRTSTRSYRRFTGACGSLSSCW